MKIYTKAGDDGRTGLLGSERVFKDDPRVEAVGTVDELNALLGIVRALGLDPRTDGWLSTVQNDLFVVGAALADPDPNGPFRGALTAGNVAQLEQAIDAIEAELPPLQSFILPGGPPAAALLHLARTVCRRAERRVVAVRHGEAERSSDRLTIYLNRLGDLLFVLARAAARAAGAVEVPWSGLGR